MSELQTGLLIGAGAGLVVGIFVTVCLLGLLAAGREREA